MLIQILYKKEFAHNFYAHTMLLLVLIAVSSASSTMSLSMTGFTVDNQVRDLNTTTLAMNTIDPRTGNIFGFTASNELYQIQNNSVVDLLPLFLLDNLFDLEFDSQEQSLILVYLRNNSLELEFFNVTTMVSNTRFTIPLNSTTHLLASTSAWNPQTRSFYFASPSSVWLFDTVLRQTSLVGNFSNIVDLTYDYGCRCVLILIFDSGSMTELPSSQNIPFNISSLSPSYPSQPIFVLYYSEYIIPINSVLTISSTISITAWDNPEITVVLLPSAELTYTIAGTTPYIGSIDIRNATLVVNVGNEALQDGQIITIFEFGSSNGEFGEIILEGVETECQSVIGTPLYEDTSYQLEISIVDTCRPQSKASPTTPLFGILFNCCN